MRRLYIFYPTDKYYNCKQYTVFWNENLTPHFNVAILLSLQNMYRFFQHNKPILIVLYLAILYV